MCSDRSSRGYSLVELMVSTALGVLFLVAMGALFRPALDISHLIAQQAAVQQSARTAFGVLTRELTMAGSGMPGGGIQLPGGIGSQLAKFACDSGGCYLTNNEFSDRRLYALAPGDSKGPLVNGNTTDVVTIAYRDPNSNLDQLPLLEVNPNGDQIRFDGATSPAYDDPVAGVSVGEALVLCNIHGCAAAVATEILTGGFVGLGSDPLKINQPTAEFGNVVSIRDPGVDTRAFRIVIVTYFIDNSSPDLPRLMRQANAHPPQLAALYVENLQLSYDIFDENTATVTGNLADAGGAPNQIRKINISVGSRAPSEGLFGKGYERMTLTTSLNARNLRFRDLY